MSIDTIKTPPLISHLNNACPAISATNSESKELEQLLNLIKQQDLNSPTGFSNALKAFSKLSPEAINSLGTDHAHQDALRPFYLAVQAHQDWFEDSFTFIGPHIGDVGIPAPNRLQFSAEQQAAMRTAFKKDDGLITNGELLLAYQDRVGRNEVVTQQYYELSRQMAAIVGDDNANWATYAVWASNEIGIGLNDKLSNLGSQAALGDTSFWLSKGNSKLISDVGPAFQYFVETFGDGKNRQLSFEQFWTHFETARADRHISYVNGELDPQHVDHGLSAHDDMKNAFKAYYEAMQLADQKHTGQAKVGDDQKRAQLMLLANSQVVFQEQKIPQEDIDHALQAFGMTNPFGMLSIYTDMDVPTGKGKNMTKIHLDQDLDDTAQKIKDLNFDFILANGTQINAQDYLTQKLNGFDGNVNNENEANPANTGTRHWEEYSQRVGFIYHWAADEQQNPALFDNPQDYQQEENLFENLTHSTVTQNLEDGVKHTAEKVGEKAEQAIDAVNQTLKRGLKPIF